MNPSLLMFALLVMTLLALASTGALLWLWRRRRGGSSAAGSDALRQELMLREASEKRLRGALQQYKRSAADFEQFAYAASHDLQTPLHNIEGFARLLERRSGDQLDDESRSFVAQILQGVQQTQKLVDALLQLSRIGRRDARIEHRSVGEAFEQARAQLAGEIAQLDAQIVVPEWPVIDADHALLAQLFRNLVANALKYQPPGRTPRLTVEVRAERDDWHFTFTDNGIGIPPEQVDHVFAPFHRLHSQAEFSGTGMGLAICRKIATYHDGEIWAEPHEGGAQIHLLLPSRARPQGATSA
jgi:signal transduction histidine kinase